MADGFASKRNVLNADATIYARGAAYRLERSSHGGDHLSI